MKRRDMSGDILSCANVFSKNQESRTKNQAISTGVKPGFKENSAASATVRKYTHTYTQIRDLNISIAQLFAAWHSLHVQ